MRPDELDAAVGVWREANIARGAPHGSDRTARIRAKLSASDALPFVALRPEIVGMALAEPGRFGDGAGELDPSLLHISMVSCIPPHNAQESAFSYSVMSLTWPTRWTASASASGPPRRTRRPAGSTSVPG
jgi:hypothetical protein